MMLNVKVLLICLVIASSIAEEKVGYKFEYGVDDPHTKDHKSHYEHREGDHVVGAYSLKEPDGSLRTVHYKSGPHSGFEAVVEKTGHTHQQPEDNHGFY